jgi:cAMP-dependent protein kinase regulator
LAVALRAKRKGVIYGDTNLIDSNYQRKVVPKDAATREMLATAMRENILFAMLGEAEITDLINAMEPRVVPAGTVVIRQGDPGDNFYVVESGRVSA